MPSRRETKLLPRAPICIQADAITKLWHLNVVALLLCLVAHAGAQQPVALWVVSKDTTDTMANMYSTHLPAQLRNVSVLWKTEDLVDHPSLHFSGTDSYVEIADAPVLNPEHLTLSVWFKLPEGRVFGQKPLVVKSAPRHEGAMYQYGLFVADDPDYPEDPGVLSESWRSDAGACREERAAARGVELRCGHV
jgi:hypothetical protein